MSKTPPIISCRNISKTYMSGNVLTTVLSDIDLDVARGEFVCLMGPSGCGKSTLLNLLGLLVSPTAGELIIGGVSTQKLRASQRAQFRSRAIGFIFQGFNLLEELSVVDNVSLPLKFAGVSRKERTALSMEILERVGLGYRAEHTPSQLSGGQQQRAAIARAVVSRTEIILADEPTGNLDPKTGAEIMDLLLELRAEGSTIVMVSHSEIDGDTADRVLRFDGGELLTA